MKRIILRLLVVLAIVASVGSAAYSVGRRDGRDAARHDAVTTALADAGSDQRIQLVVNDGPAGVHGPGPLLVFPLALLAGAVVIGSRRRRFAWHHASGDQTGFGRY